MFFALVAAAAPEKHGIKIMINQEAGATMKPDKPEIDKELSDFIESNPTYIDWSHMLNIQSRVVVFYLLAN